MGMILGGILAVGTSQPGGTSGGMSQLIQSFGFLIPVALIFYFLLIAPERKRRKQHQAMLDSLKAGDKVVTGGGIYGTVVGVTDEVVQLRIAPEVKIEVAKQSVATRQENGR